MGNITYVIKMISEVEEKYLFNARVLVENIEYARLFNEKVIAKKYLARTGFNPRQYEIIEYNANK